MTAPQLLTKLFSANKAGQDTMVTPYLQDKGGLQKGFGHCAIKL